MKRIQEPCPICGGQAGGLRVAVRAGELAACSACGSWYRVPRPTRDELARIYNQDYYNAWGLQTDSEMVWSTKTATLAPLLSRIERFLPKKPNERARLLDVGAATGVLMSTAETRGWTAFGVELNPYGAGVIREKFGADRIFEGELHDCPFDAGSFDALTLTDVIEHVLDVPGAIRDASRLLRPGGVLCMTTPRIDSWSRRLMGAGWLHFKEEHIQYFSRRAIQRVVEQAGFRDVAVSGQYKYLSVEYLHHQLQTYPHGLFTPTVAVFRRLLPPGWRSRPMPLRWGEMLVLARR